MSDYEEKKCEGACPKCGASGGDIEVIDIDVVDDSRLIEYQCRECETEFTEVSEIVYSKTVYEK